MYDLYIDCKHSCTQSQHYPEASSNDKNIRSNLIQFDYVDKVDWNQSRLDESTINDLQKLSITVPAPLKFALEL